ncbi:sensor histidine kinase [Paractinoplanes globisporus]|uniref:histidine kinase n=1 Tax=Paractinoplanes globisporus TaxID=113565 RepID=A0ABW6W4X4_9ACTN|nr:sensor histidine kinase [Actinoplanes globisporus]
MDTLAGVALALAGLGIWQRRRPLPSILLLASAALWFVGGFVQPLVFAHRGPLTHALVGHPRGRLTTAAERVVVAAGYATALVYPVGRPGVVTVLVGVAVVAVIAWGGRRPSVAWVTALACAVAFWGLLSFGAVARWEGLLIDPQILLAYDAVVIAVAVALLAETRLRRSPIAGLAVDLGQAAPRSVRDLLARALGDPSLVLGYADPVTGRLVDEAGRPVEPGAEPAGRTVTELRDNGARIAVLIHDSTVLDDPALVASAAALTRIALVNARLQAEAADRLAAVEVSRRRLLTVADAERDRLEAELRADVLARLDRVADLVDGDALRAHLVAGTEAINDFARGVYPRLLTESGPAVAVQDLASRARIPVAVTAPDGRFAPESEAAAYFVCAEGLTNIDKYASATSASVRIVAAADRLTVEVADDGVGGADPGGGSGLTGLADRLAVLGGRLVVDSPPGGGTRLTAVVPLTTRSPRPAGDTSC